MINSSSPDPVVTPARTRPRPIDVIQAGLASRRRSELAFQWLGRAAIGIALMFLSFLLYTIVENSRTAFVQTEMRLTVDLSDAALGLQGQRDEETLGALDYQEALRLALERQFPEVQERSQLRALHGMISRGAQFELRDMVLANPTMVGQTHTLWFLTDDEIDMLIKGRIDRNVPEDVRVVSDAEIAWADTLLAQGHLDTKFNSRFFTNGDSREPEQAGIRGAVMGSIYLMLVTLAISFPLAVGAAIYLEEFAPRNRFTDLIEVNINNLAAVPSIIFGLLGLAIFINWFGMPRSVPLVGGLVLALGTLPTIIIAARSALRAVPPSIRDAALGVGASRMQTVFHHVVPLAMPGILTGTIVGMAQALGDTAPLLMIGMVAFISDIPSSVMDPATVLPVQIYIWASSPERAFVEKTSAAIVVLLVFLILMNLSAVLLRRRFERRW